MDIIGIGAQKAGTSWIYACLYEHPELCMPQKELHFFSRERNFSKGIRWYEEQFSNCGKQVQRGEFSTSYLYSNEAASRIHNAFPHAKILASLRNPVDRAFSHYINARKAGEIARDMSFDQFIEIEPSAIDQGYYACQLKRYLSLFDPSQVHIMIYEDSKVSPKQFIKALYQFLGVDDTFEPVFLNKKVNVARTPKRLWVDHSMIRVAEALRRVHLDKLVWQIKKSGIPALIRSVNTDEELPELSLESRERLERLFASDVAEVTQIIGTDLNEIWYDYRKYL